MTIRHLVDPELLALVHSFPPLHFHGGGQVIGMPEMNLPQLMNWAALKKALAR